MAYKSILVPITAAETASNTLDLAFRLATSFDAHVDGMHIQRDLSGSTQSHRAPERAASTAGAIEGSRHAIERIGEEAKVAFDRQAADHGLRPSTTPAAAAGPTSGWLTVTGNEVDEVATRGGAYDLLVVGRPLPRSDGSDRQIAEAAIFGTGRPVLLAPPERPETLARHIMIAWNRGIPAGRAVAAALPLLKAADQATVFTVTTGAKRGPSPEAVVQHLAWHGIAADVKEVPPDYRRVGEALLEEAKALGADMLAMGGYSHSRLRERILGGVSIDILGHAELPVLIVQ